MTMPGDLLAEADAVVRFDSTEICPGYVTVAPGTAVTWRNHDQDAAAVQILDAYPGPDAGSVGGGMVAAHADWQRRFEEPDVYYYTVEAIPGFVGTVEVRVP